MDDGQFVADHMVADQFTAGIQLVETGLRVESHALVGLFDEMLEQEF